MAEQNVQIPLLPQAQPINVGLEPPAAVPAVERPGAVVNPPPIVELTAEQKLEVTMNILSPFATMCNSHYFVSSIYSQLQYIVGL